MSERLEWDEYFICVAVMASMRSNCRKRKVGCVIVKENRIKSTGMNGTPSGMLNCIEGGCGRCNDKTIHKGQRLDECVCLHAEENALLEISREELSGSKLYCTSYPCLGCLKKIVQCGIREICYRSEYIENEISNALIRESGVTMKKIEVPREKILILMK